MGHSNREGWIAFSLDRATADRAAAVFHLERRERHRMDGDLRWRFEAPAHVRLGAHVPFRFLVENHAARAIDIYFGGAYRSGAGRDDHFACAISRGGQPLLDPDANAISFGGLGGHRRIGAGARERVEEALDHWARFDRPGTYTARCRYRTVLSDPASEDWHWESSDLQWDFEATGELTVVVDP
jgi:hypothetical protein